ncbi:hypothetical protein [Protaetiibacter mangrovi]|uniref:Di-and tripeptidase n=1 Tax=Protaetiibacter mangrovi TaxID=2970926 RepID=A0ABT1ZIL9_9MICO|nr:hypothetical protein [Protaetiibacter mangrovi]MCS0500564.1 hypothetical protein [Protaetiibacter mangrovi]
MEESAAERRGPAADPVGPGSELVPAAPPTPTVLPPVSGSETPGAAGDEVAGGAGDSRLDQLLDRVMSVHRPAVLAHLRGIRSRYPDATPEQVLRILERRYLTTVTTSGAGVGVAAAVPAVGTGAALALSGAETVLFLEATALFAQSVAELHGIPVDDPERGRALVLAMVIGGPSQELIAQFTGQATGRGPAKPEFWGTLIAKNLPRTAVTQFMDRVRKVYLPRMLASAGGGIVGRVLPFGVGAVVGGTANQLLGRRVVKTARTAFGPPPYVFPSSTQPKVVAPGPRATKRAERAVAAGERRAIRAAKRNPPHPG